jgi:hypothetical protein
VGAVSLGLQRHGCTALRRQRRERREHRRELPSVLLAQAPQALRVEGAEVVVERVDEYPEGELLPA